MAIYDLYEVDEETGCWNWKKFTPAPHRYPMWQGKAAHRVVYEIFREEIPSGMTLDHLCLNKRCVNPEHQEVVSRGENAARYWRSKTHCPAGHEYTPENTFLGTKTGARNCRECSRTRSREYMRHRRAET